MSAVDQYAGWTQLLAIKKENRTVAGMRKGISDAGLDKLINLDDPLSGFYRSRAGKGTPFLPVAIWRDEGGALCVTRGGDSVKLETVWPYCVWNPVSHEEFVAVSDDGARWSDEDEAIAAARETEIGNEPGIGDNSKDTRTPEEIVKAKIDVAVSGIDAHATVSSDDQAAKAQSLRSLLLELSSDADKKREKEKAPHWERCKATDAKWQPLVKCAKDGADKIRAALSAWETAKAKAERERLAAEQKKHDDAIALAAKAGQPAPVVPANDVEPPKAQPTTIRGGHGRAATVRPVQVVTVTDQLKVCEYFRENAELIALAVKLAQQAVNNGDKGVPGITIEEQRGVA